MDKSDLKISPLQEISDEELMRELFLRFDDVIFAGRKREYKKDNHFDRRYYHGDYHACAGLAMAIVQICMKDAWGEREK